MYNLALKLLTLREVFFTSGLQGRLFYIAKEVRFEDEFEVNLEYSYPRDIEQENSNWHSIL